MSQEHEGAAHRHHDRHDAWFDKQNETTIQNGTLAIRTAFLLNGGACLALLAFLANTLTATGLTSEQQALIQTILSTLRILAWGAFLSAVATGIGYLVNRCYLEGNFRMTKTYTPPYIVRTTASNWWLGIGNTLNVVAIAVTIASLVAFLMALLAISAAAT